MTIGANDYQLNDLWKAGDGSNFRNTYFFRHTAGPGAALELCQMFNNLPVTAISVLLSSDMTHVGCEAFSILDPTDFASDPDTTSGQDAFQPMPNFCAVSLRVVRSDRSFRDGSKRYGRITENIANGNQLTAAGLTNLESLALVLDGDIIEGTDVYRLLIPKRTKDIDGKYKLVDFNVPLAVVARDVVTTQNTRKRGVGE